MFHCPILFHIIHSEHFFSPATNWQTEKIKSKITQFQSLRTYCISYSLIEFKADKKNCSLSLMSVRAT